MLVERVTTVWGRESLLLVERVTTVGVKKEEILFKLCYAVMLV